MPIECGEFSEAVGEDASGDYEKLAKVPLWDPAAGFVEDEDLHPSAAQVERSHSPPTPGLHWASMGSDSSTSSLITAADFEESMGKVAARDRKSVV